MFCPQFGTRISESGTFVRLKHTILSHGRFLSLHRKRRKDYPGAYGRAILLFF